MSEKLIRTPEGPIFYACWMTRGQWEIRVDSRHQDRGHTHIHIRRRRNAKGEFSWNADGTRHDKHRFPVSEAMIGKAKEIAANELKIPITSLEFLTGLPKETHSRIAHDYSLTDSDAVHLDSRVYIESTVESVVLVSENWLIIIAPELDENPESAAIEAVGE